MHINLPVMLLKKVVLLPFQEIRLDLNNEISNKIIDLSIIKHNSEILIVCPSDIYEESPDVSDLPSIGVIGKIKSRIELPNGNLRIVVSGESRVKIVEYYNELDEVEILKARTTKLDKIKYDEVEETTLKRKIFEQVNEYIECSSKVSNSLLSSINKTNDLDELTDRIVSFVPFNIDKKLLYMHEANPLHRANALVYDLSIELQVLKLDSKLDDALRIDFEKNQKEYLLKEKITEIKKELGDLDFKDDLIADYLERINNMNCDGSLKNKLVNEVKKLDYTSEMSPEVSIIRNYLDLVLDLPYGIYSNDETDLNEIREYLDKTHFGLDIVKERIIEYIAVKTRNKNLKSPIICLVGPPGVGKTSLAIAIAKSLNKEFYKISVGGLNDSSELNGHRRTYIGSSPGKIIEALKKCGTSNPLILIDEVDKMVKDYKGDPASVLLDILDPEQNYRFTDNYVGEPFDLSNVLFILTANYEEYIPEALKDRLEIINLSSYTEFEKLDIAKKYLIPNIFQEHLICSKEIKISNDIILDIINKYTKEAGVRELQRTLSTIVRKIVTNSVRESNSPIKVNLKKSDLIKYLGPIKYEDNLNIKDRYEGLSTALAVTPKGGKCILIETTSYKGTGEYTMTGTLGDELIESIKVSFSYLKSHQDLFNLKDYNFNNKDYHIHFLDSTMSKDGPSSGLAIVTSILSLLLNKKIDGSIAMTGEISLNGNVIKVGSIKEKIIGAYNSGIKTIYIPEDNLNDIEEIPSIVKEEINIIGVKNYIEIYKELFDKID